MIESPFDPARPVAAGNLLDRRPHLDKILGLVRERRNLLLYGPRRTGKTSLLLAALQHLEKDHLTIYLDCTRQTDDDAIAQGILTAFSRTGAARMARFWEWARDQIRGTRTRITQPADGPPTLELEPGAKTERSVADALELVGRFATAADETLVVVLDEFQVIMARDTDGERMAEIRSVVQDQPHVTYVLSGSETTVLRRLVADRKAPFWRQLVEMPLDGIGIDDIITDLEPHLPAFPEDARELLREACGTNTQRLVEVLDRIWRAGKKTSHAAVMEAIRSVVLLHTPDFERELRLVKPGQQRRCLLGLARDRPAHPTGGGFVRAHDLGTPASVSRVLDRLRALEILDEENRFTDPLFAWWLRQA